MISFWINRFRRQIWHPSFEDLMLYLDGEPGSKGGQVGEHTKHCWFCRLRLQKVERAISEFMEVRNSFFAGSTKLPPRALRNFEDKLARLELESRGPKFLSVLMRESGPFGLHVAPRAAVFAVLLVGLFVGFLRMSLTTPVSASELLARVQAEQSAELDKVTAPVLHQRLRVRRKVAGSSVQTTTDYDSWEDRSRGRYHQTGSSAEILTELRTIYNANRLDWQAPLSAAGYARWRDSLPAKQDTVAPAGRSTVVEKSDGPEPLALTTIPDNQAVSGPAKPNPDQNRITKAELVVRTADWHPVKERLWVSDREYEIAELEYKVLPLSQVSALLFAEPPATVEPAAAPRPVVVEPKVTLAPPPPDPEETEMAVRYGLHQIDADLGEPIEISRGSQGKIIVDASAADPELQAKLQQQLAAIPNAGLVLDRPPGPAYGAGLAPSQEATEKSPSQSLTFAPPINPNEKRLDEIRGGPDARESFTREVLAISGDALSHGFALRNLALRYPAEEEAKLTPISRAHLREMVGDHVAVLIERANSLKGFLWPLLQALSNNSAPDLPARQVPANGAASDEAGGAMGTGIEQVRGPDSSSPWQTRSFETLASVQKVDRLLETLLPRTNNPMPAAQVVPGLRQALSEELQDLSQYQAGEALNKTIEK